MSYDPHFYDVINAGSIRSAEVIVPLVMDLVGPSSVCDVGCGEGAWLSSWQNAGCDVVGLDGDYVNRERLLISSDDFVAADLSQTWYYPDLNSDLVTSLEVAEHLPGRAAPGFVEQLCKVADVVLFSAAIPGQSGANHINCQWPDYWAALFGMHGFQMSGDLRWKIWMDPRVEPWYRQNLMICAKNPTGRLAELFGKPVWPLVHPEIWAWK